VEDLAKTLPASRGDRLAGMLVFDRRASSPHRRFFGEAGNPAPTVTNTL
jgi:hypothetical protein